MRTITSSIKVYGTAAERAAMRDSDIPDNQEITFVEDDTDNEYQWNGTDWVQTRSAGAAKVYISSQADMDSRQTIAHIASGTTPTGSVTAGSWINRAGYDRGVIEISISDVTPAGDLGGEFQIAYSTDAGVTSSPYETLVAVSNIGADDDQTLIVDLSTIKGAPYFKVKEVMTGTLTAVTFGVNVYLERLRG